MTPSARRHQETEDVVPDDQRRGERPAAGAAATARARQVLGLQHRAGNAAVARLLQVGRETDALPAPAPAPPRGTAVNKYARVGTVDPHLSLRRTMDPRAIVGDVDPLLVDTLHFNDRVYVLEQYPQDWVRVRSDAGLEGYVSRLYLFIGAPEPEAKLYKTRSGDTALGIAQREYHCGEWGKDGRFFTNVLVHVNQGAGDPSRGIYKTDPDASWASSQVTAGTWIWIPSEDFARSLAGVVSSGSITYELWQGVKGFVGFIVGLLDGFVSALVDLVTGIVDLVSSVVDVVVKIVRDGVTATIEEIKALIAKIDPAEIAGAIWDSFVTRWNAEDAWDRWKFRGVVVGTLVAELLLAFFSGGGALLAKAASKFGKLGALIRNSKTVSRVLAAADKASDSVPGVKKLKDKLRERTARKRDEGDDGGPRRATGALELFADPSLLAGKGPDDVAGLFPGPVWVRKAAGAGTGGGRRSSGAKFELQGPSGGAHATFRWSGGESGRHFRGPDGTGQPYWKVTVSGGRPSQLWVGPDGKMYTRPPVYKAGRVDPANPPLLHSGPIEIPDAVRDLMR